ncbi:MAG: metallophosphoesterase [Pseudomonadota bacterium]
METLESLKKAELIFISDVHMASGKDTRGQLLSELLESLAQLEVESIVLGGDIFEFCFGRKDFYRKKFSILNKPLENLHAAQSSVHFIHGNHEFFVDYLNWPHVRMVREKDIHLTINSGRTKVVIAHGDLINPPKTYLKYISLVKSRFFYRVLCLIPARFIDFVALKFATKSRSMDAERELNHQKIVDDGFRWVKQHQASVGIFGHFHYPYESQKNGVSVLCGWSWKHPNFIAYVNGAWMRGVWRSSKWEIHPITFEPHMGPRGDASLWSQVIPGG